jgi:glycosyltransferase involved in cell wall biosynthesis
MMGRNLKKYLKTRKKPDVIYCAVPSLDAAMAVSKYARKNKVKFIIDVQDLWPEAFRMVFNIPVVSDLIFYPMEKMADHIYQSADEIVAVSETYMNRALKVNKKLQSGHCIYLGTDLHQFDLFPVSSMKNSKLEGEIWIAYVGTLGSSYDLISVIDALRILKERGENRLKFIVMGDGPLKEKFESCAKESSVEALFTGRLQYKEMVGILKACDIAINPIAKGAAQSIINKHADYASAGLPVINTQESREYRELIEQYNMGLNCNPEDPEDIAEKIMILINNQELRLQLGRNGRKLAEERFDRRKNYQRILNLIDKYASNEYESQSLHVGDEG